MPWGFLQLNKEPEDSNDITRNAANMAGSTTNAAMSKSEIDAQLELEKLEKLENERNKLLNNNRN